jgi:hypothetical protein
VSTTTLPGQIFGAGVNPDGSLSVPATGAGSMGLIGTPGTVEQSISALSGNVGDLLKPSINTIAFLLGMVLVIVGLFLFKPVQNVVTTGAKTAAKVAAA